MLFILLLQKGGYPYGYSNDWKKLNQRSLHEKENFYSNLNMEDFNFADSTHGKRVFKDSEIKSLGEYHDLYIQSNKLLLADVFENVQNMCLKMYVFDHAKFLSSSGLAWLAALRKTKLKLDLLTDIDIFLIAEKGIRGGKCPSIYRYT